jgi:hypothetical protein
MFLYWSYKNVHIPMKVKPTHYLSYFQEMSVQEMAILIEGMWFYPDLAQHCSVRAFK